MAAAVGLALAALGILIWFLVSSTSVQAWLVSLATVIAAVLAAWVIVVAMLAWVRRSRASVLIHAGASGVGPDGHLPVLRVRVSEADPRRLGVHAAISVPGVPDDVPPEYVPRDADADQDGVRNQVAAAAHRGGFVLLVGGSSVGKTRSAFEAVKALLPGWSLVHPAGPDQVAALAAAPSRRMVVWLNELQCYLDGEHGLTAATVRALLNARHPAVIIGTLWPDRYTAYTTAASGNADPHAREREVLDLAAAVIHIGPQLSPAEQNRAHAGATRDPRLAIALKTTGYGLTQTLAAAPQLVGHWRDAQAARPYGWAVLTAALDAARLGARAPLSAGFLRAAAPGYCTSAQQAKAPADWFDQALAYATKELRSTAAALSPAGTGIMGQIAGYTVADYLIEHGSQERRSVPVPPTTWDALLGHIRDPADAIRLADNASNRLLYHYAISLHRRATDAGDRQFTDRDAAVQWADLLIKRGDMEGAARILQARVDAGDTFAPWRLAVDLAARGDLDALQARADAGDWYAAEELADLLAERGDMDGAEQVLRARANAGERDAAAKLAGLLAVRGDVDGLQARADAGDPFAPRHLAGLLAEQMAERGDVDGLLARATAGDRAAARWLAILLAEDGDLDGLQALADADDPNAAERLAELLAVRGDLDELRVRTKTGDVFAARALAELLAIRGDLDELRARADAGSPAGRAAADQLAGVLVARGDLDELRTRADADDLAAAAQLAFWLAEHGDLDELRARARVGDTFAARRLADLLIKQGRREEAERLRRFGLNPDGSTACE
jgi:hypothetical protein